MAKKQITMDDLAGMVQRGFEEVTENMATKSELKNLETNINKRFDKIEKLMLADHKMRIEKLEMEVKELKDLLAFK